MSFICKWMKTHKFHMKGFTLSLTLKQRLKVARIKMLVIELNLFIGDLKLITALKMLTVLLSLAADYNWCKWIITTWLYFRLRLNLFSCFRDVVGRGFFSLRSRVISCSNLMLCLSLISNCSIAMIRLLLLPLSAEAGSKQSWNSLSNLQSV